MFKKILLIGVVLICIIAATVYYYVFIYSVENHRDISKEEATFINATDLTKAFIFNEGAANQLYLNKVLEVKGAVLQIAQDQTLHKTVLLGSEMELSNVLVTLKDSSVNFKIGDTISVKAICNGFLSDVVLTDGIVKY